MVKCAAFALALSLSIPQASSADVLGDTRNRDNWAGYGRTHDQDHYSPLTDINSSNVSRLGLAWWFDIPGIVLASSVPLAVNGRLYFATGYSVVRAVDAASGKLLWSYDPEVFNFANRKLRLLWGVRGIAFLNDKIYVGTHDGRLIALDANTGKSIWNVSTTQPGDLRVISGPPLAFKNRVLIGHGIAEYGAVRGYVTAYDAESGRQVWRFFTVPGNPNRGFENKAMEMAAKTWTGHWWTYGGGGTVWNAMTYDADLNRVYVGTGNGSPWMAKLRSPAGGDNLFVAAIVALDADTGTYIWHYQTNPSETWDYDATEDIELGDVIIDGTLHHVLMQASKNGFFYVIDRDNGKLLSAKAFAKVTWAHGIDLKTGRPVEAANARQDPPKTLVWPFAMGAHSYPPMAFNSTTGLAYIPVFDRSNDNSQEELAARDPYSLLSGFLLAWNPLEQKAAWRLRLPALWNGGVATTAGNLVFQGRGDGKFAAYAADSGKQLWEFDAQAGIVGAPISYKVAGRQYVSVMAGFSGIGSVSHSSWDARTQPRRLLTFSLDGNVRLPFPPLKREIVPVNDPTFKPKRKTERIGALKFDSYCVTCHGRDAAAGGAAPDLRASAAILSTNVFTRIVKDGALLRQGMPRFEELSSLEIESLRQYLRARAKSAATQEANR